MEPHVVVLSAEEFARLQTTLDQLSELERFRKLASEGKTLYGLSNEDVVRHSCGASSQNEFRDDLPQFVCPCGEDPKPTAEFIRNALRKKSLSYLNALKVLRLIDRSKKARQWRSERIKAAKSQGEQLSRDEWAEEYARTWPVYTRKAGLMEGARKPHKPYTRPLEKLAAKVGLEVVKSRAKRDTGNPTTYAEAREKQPVLNAPDLRDGVPDTGAWEIDPSLDGGTDAATVRIVEAYRKRCASEIDPSLDAGDATITARSVEG